MHPSQVDKLLFSPLLSLSLRSPFLYALPLAAPSVLLVATVCPRLDRRFFGRINLIKTIRYETFFIEREEWAAVLRYGLATNDVHRFVSFPFLPFHLSKNIVAMPRKSFAFRSRDVFVDGRGEDGGFFISKIRSRIFFDTWTSLISLYVDRRNGKKKKK